MKQCSGPEERDLKDETKMTAALTLPLVGDFYLNDFPIQNPNPLLQILL